MKKSLAIASVVLLALYCVAMVVVVLSPLNPRSPKYAGMWLKPGFDYMLRVSEIDCLRRGVNPFDVWHGDVVLKPYIPFSDEGRRAFAASEGFTEEINAYPPWEYAMMMPFAVLPRQLSWFLYLALTLVGVWMIFFAGRSFCSAVSGRRGEVCTIVGAASILLVSIPILHNSQLGNLAFPVLVAAVFMAICLNRGYDALAGVCWAFAMLKPQLGLAFAIPLLMFRKFKTCVVAMAICALLSAIPALMCHTSPVTLTMQGVAGSAHAFIGCGTLPYFICTHLANGTGIVVGLAIGALLCVVMTHSLVVSGLRNWIVLLLPAAITGAVWTYAHCFSFVMGWFFFVVLCSSLVRWPKSRFLWVVALLSAIFMTRIFNFVHFLPAVFPGIVPEFPLSERWHAHISTLNSTGCVLLTVALCVWLSRRAKENCAMAA